MDRRGPGRRGVTFQAGQEECQHANQTAAAGGTVTGIDQTRVPRRDGLLPNTAPACPDPAQWFTADRQYDRDVAIATACLLKVLGGRLGVAGFALRNPPAVNRVWRVAQVALFVMLQCVQQCQTSCDPYSGMGASVRMDAENGPYGPPQT